MYLSKRTCVVPAGRHRALDKPALDTMREERDLQLIARMTDKKRETGKLHQPRAHSKDDERKEKSQEGNTVTDLPPGGDAPLGGGPSALDDDDARAKRDADKRKK